MGRYPYKLMFNLLGHRLARVYPILPLRHATCPLRGARQGWHVRQSLIRRCLHTRCKQCAVAYESSVTRSYLCPKFFQAVLARRANRERQLLQ